MPTSEGNVPEALLRLVEMFKPEEQALMGLCILDLVDEATCMKFITRAKPELTQTGRVVKTSLLLMLDGGMVSFLEAAHIWQNYMVNKDAIEAKVAGMNI